MEPLPRHPDPALPTLVLRVAPACACLGHPEVPQEGKVPRLHQQRQSWLSSQGKGTVDIPGQGWPAYLWARGSWKTSCHTEKSPFR